MEAGRFDCRSTSSSGKNLLAIGLVHDAPSSSAETPLIPDQRLNSDMRLTTRTLLFPVILVLAAACASPEASTIAEEGAVRLEGWDSVNNLFQDGRMYFGGQPDEASLSRLASEGGVRTVINIRHPGEMSRVGFDEREVVESLGMRYVTIPVSPDSFSSEDVQQFADVVNSTDDPLLLHCASSNRVGGMWAAYLALHRGVDADEAIELGRSVGLRSESMISAARRVVAN